MVVVHLADRGLAWYSVSCTRVSSLREETQSRIPTDTNTHHTNGTSFLMVFQIVSDLHVFHQSPVITAPQPHCTPVTPKHQPCLSAMSMQQRQQQMRTKINKRPYLYMQKYWDMFWRLFQVQKISPSYCTAAAKRTPSINAVAHQEQGPKLIIVMCDVEPYRRRRPFQTFSTH